MAEYFTDSKFLKVFGIAEATRQMKALPKEAIEAFGDAAYLTAQLVAYRAAAKAPIRRTPLRQYRGGALRQMIGASRNRTTGEALVGIKRGALVARTSGRETWVTRQRYGQRSQIVQRGKRKGQYVKTGYKMILKLEERKKIRAAGSAIIQPTKYGHFAELGHGGRRGQARAQPFMGVAIEQSRDYFLAQMRRAASVSADHLAAMGFIR